MTIGQLRLLVMVSGCLLAQCSPAQSEPPVLEMLKHSSHRGSLWTALEKTDPAATHAAATEIASKMPDGEVTREATVEADRQANSIFQKNMIFVAKAPDAILVQLSRDNALQYQRLQSQSPELCRAFALATIKGSAPSPSLAASVSDENTKMTVRYLAVASKGKQAGLDRPLVSENDKKRYREELARAGATTDEIGQLKSLQSAPDEQLCRLSILMYGAVAALPPEIAGRAYSDLQGIGN